MDRPVCTFLLPVPLPDGLAISHDFESRSRTSAPRISCRLTTGQKEIPGALDSITGHAPSGCPKFRFTVAVGFERGAPVGFGRQAFQKCGGREASPFLGHSKLTCNSFVSKAAAEKLHHLLFTLAQARAIVFVTILFRGPAHGNCVPKIAYHQN